MKEKSSGAVQLEPFRNGDAEAFNQIYRCYYRRLYHFACGLTGDEAVAQDMVAESMIKLWERRSGFEGQQQIKAFLYISTRNACLDYLRKLKKQHAGAEELAYLMDGQAEEYALTRMIETELLHEIYLELEQLPARARHVFELTYLQGCSSGEVAQSLNMTLTAVRNNKFRALRALRSALLKKQVLVLAWLSLIGQAY